MRSKNPFSELVRVATTADTDAKPAPDLAASLGKGTHTSQLLYLLNQGGGMTTRQLADAAALTLNQVWGLLKTRRDRRVVAYSNGVWTLCEIGGRDLQCAIELLRDNGFKVSHLPGLMQW